jgi:hypothetical protein
MDIVVDASVAVKWFNVKDEDNVDLALEGVFIKTRFYFSIPSRASIPSL